MRLEITEQLNQLLADTMTIRDLYKPSHWQVAGPTFYQLHILFDKHFGEQVELVDGIAERIQLDRVLLCLDRVSSNLKLQIKRESEK